MSEQDQVHYPAPTRIPLPELNPPTELHPPTSAASPPPTPSPPGPAYPAPEMALPDGAFQPTDLGRLPSPSAAPSPYPRPTVTVASAQLGGRTATYSPTPSTATDQSPYLSTVDTGSAVVPTEAIATIAPLPAPEATGYPRSARTGRPRRPWTLTIASAAFWVAAGCGALAYVPLWWTATSVSGLPESARLFGWINPDPVSLLAIILVVTTALLTVIVVGACGALAYNLWQGRAWTRWGTWVACALSGLTYLLHPWAIVTVAPALVGALAALLPGVAAFRQAMVPPAPVQDLVPVNPAPAQYGPQRLIGN